MAEGLGLCGEEDYQQVMADIRGNKPNSIKLSMRTTAKTIAQVR